MGKVRIEQVQKRFKDTIALDNISLTVEEGSFFTFLGPSGCGKTTLLRIIAGFISPDVGKIFLGDKNITDMPPENREIGMVFQSYALFPHMDVYQNVAYGLKIKKESQQVIKEKVSAYLKRVRLEGYEKRKVSELSGGEQQRVALARSLIITPKVLLLDEPLCNLDAKLRDDMREEIKRIQKELGITTIFVTHDQKEALTMSDQIAVFNKGKCIQVGSPKQIYTQPNSTFVANFIGETNLLKKEGRFISIRPEQIKLYPKDGEVLNGIQGVIEKVQFNGNKSEYKVKVKETLFKVTQMNGWDITTDFEVGQEVILVIPPQAIKNLEE